MTLPHCIGCTEPGAVTHQQETAEHIHDACNATIEALRLMGQIDRNSEFSCCRDRHWPCDCEWSQPLPPAAAKLLAERDAGRALYDACTAPYEKRIMSDTVWQAVEAYRKVVD